MLLINDNKVLWQPLHLLLDDVPPLLKDWLKEEGSLTKRLKKTYNDDFKVKVIKHHLAKTNDSERKFLGQNESEALIREVLLICAGQARIFARSVVPYSSLQDSNAEILDLGSKPLGELLFSHKHMRRVAIEIALVPAKQFNRHIDYLYTNEQAWARRSLFYINNMPLSVCEVFFPKVSGDTPHIDNVWT